MTAQPKTTIKSYFQTGDRPTQAEFGDLIDSYQDANSNLTTLASASVGAVGLAVLSATTTAAAQNSLGGGTVGKQLFQAATTAAATALINAGDMFKSTYDPANIAKQVICVSAVQTLYEKTLSAPTIANPVTSGTPTGVIASETITPTLTNGTNVAASTAGPMYYQRIGNIVTGSGTVQIDPTAATTNTELGISLPIASDFAAISDACGTAGSAGVTFGVVLADVTNNRLILNFSTTADVANRVWYYTFSYKII